MSKFIEKVNRRREEKAWNTYARLNTARKMKEGGLKLFQAADNLRRKMGKIS